MLSSPQHPERRYIPPFSRSVCSKNFFASRGLSAAIAAPAKNESARIDETRVFTVHLLLLLVSPGERRGQCDVPGVSPERDVRMHNARAQKKSPDRKGGAQGSRS